MSVEEFTDEKICGLVDRTEPLVSLRETIGEWQLGHFSLSRHNASFRVGFGGNVTDTSRFRKHPFGPTSKGSSGVALVFRQFDSSASQATPAEYFVGWVPHDRSAELDRWESFLSSELRKRQRGEESAQTEATYSRDGRIVELHLDDTVRFVDPTTSRVARALPALWRALNVALAVSKFPHKPGAVPGAREEFTLRVVRRNGQAQTVTAGASPSYSDVHALFDAIVAQMSNGDGAYVTDVRDA